MTKTEISERLEEERNSGLSESLNSYGHMFFRMFCVAVSLLFLFIAINKDACAPTKNSYGHIMFIIFGSLAFALPNLYLIVELVLQYKILGLSYEDHIREDERNKLLGVV